MDILNLFSDPLFVLLFFAASAVVMVPIIWIISCKQLTGTFSMRKFAFDRKYWALAVLNWQYRLKRTEGISTRDFVIWFNVSYLSKGFRSRWKILSNPEFIEENLGLDKYTVKEHNRILEDNPEARDIKPRGENYMSGVFKEVRAFFNWAYKNKIIDSFPFDGFEMPSEQYGSPVYLTLDDVDVIARADFSDDKEQEIQRDIFVFQCNVGCRIGDLLRLKKRDIINGAVEYIPTKTIKERAKIVVVPLNAIAMSIVEKYKDVPGDQLLPFISSQNYNENIKTILEKAGITYLVTKLDSVTRTESKVPINEMASSHMARRTIIGNIYKLVKDPNLVSALTGHAEGSRAFNRYRTIDIDMKRDLVKILEGKQ